MARASANEIADALAQCQDEDKAAELRARACTFLITSRSVEDDIRAEAYQEKRQLDRVLADLTMVIALLPDDADSYVDRGEAHAQLGNQDSAIADLKTALKLDPHNDQAREGCAASASGRSRACKGARRKPSPDTSEQTSSLSYFFLRASSHLPFL